MKVIRGLPRLIAHLIHPTMGNRFLRRGSKFEDPHPQPLTLWERGAYLMLFKIYFFTILKKVFKLILGKGFKNRKIYFETVSLPLRLGLVGYAAR